MVFFLFLLMRKLYGAINLHVIDTRSRARGEKCARNKVDLITGVSGYQSYRRYKVQHGDL